VNGTDKFTCEAMPTNAARRITAAGTMVVQDEVMAAWGVAPRVRHRDNGPEFNADPL